MKIAVVTDDLERISLHFGRAPFYMVFTVENGQIVNQEIRKKAGHQAGESHNCHEGHSCHDGNHGMDAASQAGHAGMLANIQDCQVLISRGMGFGAFQSLQNSGIEPIITDVQDIEESVYLYAEGKLVNLTEKLH